MAPNVSSIADKTTLVPTTAPATSSSSMHTEHVQMAVAVAREFADRAPAVVERVSKMGTSGLWAAVIFLAASQGVQVAAFLLHLQGDGTLRNQVDRTECHVDYLVDRALATDRGDPPPQYQPRSCDRKRP